MNTGSGIIIATCIFLATIYGWSWWYLLPLAYALAFTVFPAFTDERKELLTLEIRKLRLEIEDLQRKAGARR